LRGPKVTQRSLLRYLHVQLTGNLNALSPRPLRSGADGRM
jgi:hypothetical protein